MSNRDLTIGDPGRIIRSYCLPLFGSVLFQQLYNLADSFVAGRFIGENALAAVGNSYEITLIYLAFAFCCNTGCSVIVSRYFGAKKYDQVRTAISTSLIATGILCITLMLSGLALISPLLRLIRTPFYFLAISSTANIILDIIFVAKLNMGIAALAGQPSSARRRPVFRLYL